MLTRVFNVFSCLFFIVDAARLRVDSDNSQNLVEYQSATFELWIEDDVVTSFTPTSIVEVSSSSPDHLSVISNASFYFSSDDVKFNRNKTVNILAGSFGHGTIIITTNYTNVSELSFDVRIARARRDVDNVFLVIIIILILINTVNMGCILDLQILKSVFREPIGPIVGFCSQFVFMPLASYGFATLLLDSPDLKLGLFALGCCPGGTGSNFWTLLFDGDINLSVVMTFVSTVSALGMMPLWLFTLGQHFLQNVRVPYENIMYTLLSFIVPIGIGVGIRYRKPRWAMTAEKIIRPFTLVILIFFFTFGVYVNWFMFELLSWKIIVAGLCVGWGGYLFGAMAARIFCLKSNQIIAISIETALQNPGIAFVLLQLSLPQPDADIASVSPMSQVFLTGVPLWFVYLGCWIRRRRRKETTTDTAPIHNRNDSDQSSLPKPNDDLWISVPLRDDADDEVKIIYSAGDNADENIVWQRH